ncbi:FMN-binding protein [Patescibacteria group bacterium]|nr:FMN-binding protein [Patescibacteria group bacterium]
MDQLKKYLQITVVLGAFGLLVWVKSLEQGTGSREVAGSLPPVSGPGGLPPAGFPDMPATLTPAPTPPPAATPAPSQPRGKYKDGTYTGSVADAYYGNIQVRAVIRNGSITDVQFLQYPNDNQTSLYINSQALPILRSEAIQAQSAQVDIVSGASDSSAAFRESLGSALSQAV